MKQVILVTLLLTAVFAQAVKPVAPVTPAAPANGNSSRPPVYQDDVIVNLPAYKKENDRVRKSLDANIAVKKALVIEGNAHNANLRTVTGYVDAWKSDIAATEKATQVVVTGGKTTRTQWNGVKQTQNPNAKAPVVKAVVNKAGKKIAGAKKSTAKGFKRAFKYTAVKGGKNTKFVAASKRAGAKKAGPRSAFFKRAVAKKAVAKKAVAKKAVAKKAVAKKAVAKKAVAKKAVAKKAVAKKSIRRLQAVSKKTLESVNAQYRAQVDELEKNVNSVIVRLRAVYVAAAKDDSDAATLQARQDKTMVDLKTFLKHILQYIKWTKRTMKNYAKLFKTKPDNVFKVKANRLIKKIRAAL
jgi:hypothetical protein